MQETNQGANILNMKIVIELISKKFKFENIWIRHARFLSICIGADVC